MQNEFTYPVLARPLAMLGVFSACLITFHVLFVWLWPFTKRTWNIVDYIWLGVAAVGIVGAAGTIRRQIATNYAIIAESRAQTSYDLARHQVETLTSPAVCARFTRSEFSPPNLDVIQQEYDRICQFGRDALKKIPVQMPKDAAFPNFGKRSEISNAMLKQIFGELDQALDRYAVARREVDRLQSDKEFSPVEDTLMFLAPMLFAVAL